MPQFEMLLSPARVEHVAPKTVLSRRGSDSDSIIFVESGRAVLGLLGPDGELEHQLGVVQGPGWLDPASGVLDAPGLVDAVSENEVVLRRVSRAQFRDAMELAQSAKQSLLLDMARAHRQQTQLAVSRVAKDAEARLAEWLLRQVDVSSVGTCSVRLQQSKRLLAAHLGIAPETLSRVLRHLRDRSLISGSGRIVNLMDVSGLKNLAGQ